MINFKLPKDIPSTRCVFKLTVGEKFYIGKASNILFIKTEIQKVYGKYLRGGITEDNLFYPVVKELHKQDKPTLELEVMYQSDNGYNLLKHELEQLEEYFGTKNCLNKNNIPHIPKTVAMKKGSNWLTQNEALNFRKLLTKYEY